LYLFPEDSAHSSLDSASSIEFLHDQASFLLKSFINRRLSSTREAEEEIVSVRKHLTTALSTQRNHKQFQSNLLPLFPSRQPSLHFFLFFFSLCRLSPYLLYTKIQNTSRYYEPPLSIVITSNTGNRKGKNKNREVFSSSIQLQIRFQKSTDRSCCKLILQCRFQTCLSAAYSKIFCSIMNIADRDTVTKTYET